MNIYHQTGPNTAVGYGLGEGLFFAFLVFVGSFAFVLTAILFFVVVLAFAVILGVLLALNGIIYHRVTGRDARISVPGSGHGAAVEYWMEEKGWIRLPNRLTPTRNM